MALSPDIDLVTLQGTYVNIEGNPIGGSVRFTPNTIIKDTTYNEIIIPRPITVTLDANGFFSVSLPATDDTAYVPTPIAYRVEELFSGGRTYYLVLPVSSAGSTQDIADLGVAGSATDAANYITTDEYNTLESRATAAEDVFDGIDTIEADTELAESYVPQATAAVNDIQSNVAITPFLLMGV